MWPACYLRATTALPPLHVGARRVCVFVCLHTESHQCYCPSVLYIIHGAPVLSLPQDTRQKNEKKKNLNIGSLFHCPPFVLCLLFFPHPVPVSRNMSRPTGGGANDVTRFLSSGAGPGSPTSNAVFTAASQADWAAKRLVWVPSEKHGFEVSGK